MSAVFPKGGRPAGPGARLRRLREYETITWFHASNRPSQSAHKVLSSGQKKVLAVILASLAVGLLLSPMQALLILVAVVTTFYLIAALYKTWLVIRSISGSCETPVSRDEVDALSEEELPRYTILLPVYKEANVLRDLVAWLDALDYPKKKLDVKLLLEEDDSETRLAAKSLDLPRYFQTLIVPKGLPRGKPRACNYGLLYATGKYCVIFDAEDRPESDQLKKSLVAFSKGGPTIACVQAKLNYYNPEQNILTRWFTGEYLTWFDLYLPGLNASNAPIPLGGTSNHFLTSAIREIGGWDPFNVTEDADIGIRVARVGLRTRVIDSTTYEEATSELGNWIRQRSRWIKGYMQTWLVHMRNPAVLFREVGARGFLGIQVMILGTFLAYFLNPIMWLLVVVWYVTRAGAIDALFPGPLLYPATIALFVGNLTFVYAGILACIRRDYFEGVRYALLSPLYWCLMSVAAWMALYELVVRPHYWQKTRHGAAVTTPAHTVSRLGPAVMSQPSVVPETVNVRDR